MYNKIKHFKKYIGGGSQTTILQISNKYNKCHDLKLKV